jgi:hypothetical protein
VTRVPYLRPVDDPELRALAERHAAELRREGFGTCLNCGADIVRAYTSGQTTRLEPFHEDDGGPWTWHRNGRMCRDADAAHPAGQRYRYHRCDHQEAIADVRP